MYKRFSMREVIGLVLAVALVSASLAGCAQAPSSAASGSSLASSAAASSAAVTSENEMTVTVEIDPSIAVGRVDLPDADLAPTSQDAELPTGASAYDALAATGAVLEGSSSYVTSINGLAEKAAGPAYGWLYEVNGQSPTVSANDCTLEAGDTVRWYYTSWEES